MSNLEDMHKETNVQRGYTQTSISNSRLKSSQSLCARCFECEKDEVSVMHGAR